MTSSDRWPGRIALMVAHCAGMIDLVALPVWVGTLISRYQLDPQRAGGLATLFLLGAVGSSLFFAPRFHRMRPRVATAGGFALAGCAFLAVPLAGSYVAMAVLHAIAGFCAACALSFTHGTIGRSNRPHRLFALVGMALGVFAILFLGATPKIVATLGGAALFRVFGGLMLVAALVSAFAFPVDRRAPGLEDDEPRSRLDAPVIFGALGVACMALVQAMIFSFLERIGADHGFSANAITGVLIALGFVNLFPAPLAAVLEKRWPARSVLLCGPFVQVGLALLITQSAGFVPYAAGALFFAAVMIFTHTFAFGLLAALEPSGRILAATPAMLMTGSAIGPFIGGTLVKLAGYGALGVAAAGIGCVAVFCFSRARRVQAAPVLETHLSH
jgi:predicted MFS family arabinose efflux permease